VSALRRGVDPQYYVDDGAFVGARQFTGLDHFHRSDHCLPRLAVEVGQGFVLVNDHFTRWYLARMAV
jgi:hypothetical protein